MSRFFRPKIAPFMEMHILSRRVPLLVQIFQKHLPCVSNILQHQYVLHHLWPPLSTPCSWHVFLGCEPLTVNCESCQSWLQKIQIFRKSCGLVFLREKRVSLWEKLVRQCKQFWSQRSLGPGSRSMPSHGFTFYPPSFFRFWRKNSQNDVLNILFIYCTSPIIVFASNPLSWN